MRVEGRVRTNSSSTLVKCSVQECIECVLYQGTILLDAFVPPAPEPPPGHCEWHWGTARKVKSRLKPSLAVMPWTAGTCHVLAHGLQPPRWPGGTVRYARAPRVDSAGHLSDSLSVLSTVQTYSCVCFEGVRELQMWAAVRPQARPAAPTRGSAQSWTWLGRAHWLTESRTPYARQGQH